VRREPNGIVNPKEERTFEETCPPKPELQAMAGGE
jgi:hypothetical protein